MSITNTTAPTPTDRVGEDWILVPRLLSERMRKTLHGSVVIRCHLDKREASIMNDQAWWEAVLAAVPVPALGANDAAELARLAELSNFATPGVWYTVDTPWGDGTWLVAGNPDPHAGTMVCDCQDVNETRPQDGPDAADDAAFIAASVNYVRKLIRSGQLVASTPGQKGAGEEKTGADKQLVNATLYHRECNCDAPMVRCDSRGCRCQICGLPERLPDFPRQAPAQTPPSPPSATPEGDPPMTVKEARAIVSGVQCFDPNPAAYAVACRGIGRVNRATEIELALRTLHAAGEVRHG